MKIKKLPAAMAVISSIAAAWFFPYGILGKIIGIFFIFIAFLAGGYSFMSEEIIFVKQKNIATDTNIGAKISDVPQEGTKLPPMNIEQENIRARRNIGLEFSHNPNSGLVELSNTIVKNESGCVKVNADAGKVTINPSVGSVRFISEKAD